MIQRKYQNRIFTLSYPLLLGASLVVTFLLVNRYWSPGFEFLGQVFEIQLILVTVLWLLHILKGVSLFRRCIGIGMILPALLPVWDSAASFLGMSLHIWPQLHITGPLAGLFFLGIWTGGELAVRREEKRRNRILKRLADDTRVTQSRLKYLTARIEPEFLLSTLEGISDLRASDMERAGHLQRALVAYLKQSLSHTGANVETVHLKKQIQKIMGRI